ncbi:hypothetical protein BX616_005245 [Lobosporangium transversale]|uniref:Uncharacterized protein n=1 Tax=Lobosporangium transversale TaxID=64571 RepID=A0A1Y2GXK8_9FUNG|nr:hypothetical protein BCR41DRAFT_349653 [Lobosporangium transversale]KAF9897632.1 hypothetical protein BX616_005245 [Lobosporangium transversale]ORZ22773.1 hypothetical protein BCR41DRAFT_349653 [Lobosporangium transversale]|eukprot:XP_021883327.1 hypothetical protein BCR41DRAFT_349653 [Lobosporangium transversale]
MFKRAHKELAKNAIYTDVMPTGDDDDMAEIEALAQFSDSGSDSDSSSSDDDISSEEDAKLEDYIMKYERSLKDEKTKTKGKASAGNGSGSDEKSGSSDDDDEVDGEGEVEEEEEEEEQDQEEDTHFRCKVCPKKILKNKTMVEVHLKGHEHKTNLRLYKRALKEERTKEEIEKLKAKNQKKREKSLKKKEERKAAQKQKLKEKKKRQWERKMASMATTGSAISGSPSIKEKKEEKLIERSNSKAKNNPERQIIGPEETVGNIVKAGKMGTKEVTNELRGNGRSDSFGSSNTSSNDKRRKPPNKKQKTKA